MGDVSTLEPSDVNDIPRRNGLFCEVLKSCAGIHNDADSVNKISLTGILMECVTAQSAKKIMVKNIAVSLVLPSVPSFPTNK